MSHRKSECLTQRGGKWGETSSDMKGKSLVCPQTRSHYCQPKSHCGSKALVGKLLTEAPHVTSSRALVFVLSVAHWPYEESCKQMSHRTAVSLSSFPSRGLSPLQTLTVPNQTYVSPALTNNTTEPSLPEICTWCSCGGSWRYRKARHHRSLAGSHIPGTMMGDRKRKKQPGEQWLNKTTIVAQKQSGVLETNSYRGWGNCLRSAGRGDSSHKCQKTIWANHWGVTEKKKRGINLAGRRFRLLRRCVTLCGFKSINQENGCYIIVQVACCLTLSQRNELWNSAHWEASDTGGKKCVNYLWMCALSSLRLRYKQVTVFPVL